MYTSKNFSHLLGMEGFSDTLLKNHFTLYEGYVTNTNKLIDLMKTKEVGTPEYAELHRRFGWEYNGMKLHELYFENISNADQRRQDADSRRPDSKLSQEIEKTFGSIENFQKEFIGVGMMRGIGWVLLVKNEDESLKIIWINEHHEGLLANSKILLIMDVFEHAYMTDYSIARADYIEVFMKNINWGVVEKRF